jgi:hypothetical protein
MERKMTDKIAAEYINSIKMYPPGCEDKERCAHFYRELKTGDDFIKGEFCIRFENWPEETIREICAWGACDSFMDRENAPDNYTAAILRRRECSPGVLDLDTIFGG